MNYSTSVDTNAVTATSPVDATGLSRLYRKVGLRVLPLLILGYMLAYMDRVNISFAKLQMQHDLGMSEAVYGLAAGIFFIGYLLFEVPSNLLLERIGARKTLARIMMLWGITSASMLFVRDTHALYLLRFLLGAFEAGFGPGMLFYLTRWYGATRRARVTSYVLLASPAAGIIGGPIATWIMAHFDTLMGLAGWQWLFLVEGLPCVLLGLTIWFHLDETPAGARWLTDAEKTMLSENIVVTEKAVHHAFGAVLRDWRIHALAFSYFCMINGLYAVSFWLPTLIRSAGVTKASSVGLLSSLPYIAAVTTMVLAARYSDLKGERRLHSMIACFIAAAALAVTATTLWSLPVSLAALIVATAATYASYTVFWAIPGDYLKGRAAAGGIAYINSVGQIGGFVSPLIIGALKTLTGSLQAGLLAIVGLLFAGAFSLSLNRLKR